MDIKNTEKVGKLLKHRSYIEQVTKLIGDCNLSVSVSAKRGDVVKYVILDKSAMEDVLQVLSDMDERIVEELKKL